MTSVAVRAARSHLTRAALAAIVALTGLVLASSLGNPADEGLVTQLKDPSPEDFGALCGAIAFLVGGILTIRALVRAANRAIEEHLDDRRSTPIGLVITLVGYTLMILPTLQILGVNLSGLLLGGAITGVIVGIAAQQTLANFFAGIVLLVVRPFAVGQDVVMRSGPLGGEYEGRVTEMNFFYTDVITKAGPVKLPNAGVLAAAIGPGARAPKVDEADEEAATEREQQASPAQGGAPGP
jgi:small-conductance mechanosensitive channel